jgi:hypothetical protein
MLLERRKKTIALLPQISKPSNLAITMTMDDGVFYIGVFNSPLYWVDRTRATKMISSSIG